MIIFYKWTAARFQTFFQVNFAYNHDYVWKMAVLPGKFNRHWRVEPWYTKGFPYPVGKFTNTSLPLRKSATALSCSGLRFWTPNIKHTLETALTLVALARNFLLPTSVNAWSLAIKLLHYSHLANKLTRQPIRTTTRFSGRDITGQHYRPVPSDVSLPRLSESRRWLKFRVEMNLTKVKLL